MSVAISRVSIHREYARLPQGSLASLTHLDPAITIAPFCDDVNYFSVIGDEG